MRRNDLALQRERREAHTVARRHEPGSGVRAAAVEKQPRGLGDDWDGGGQPAGMISQQRRAVGVTGGAPVASGEPGVGVDQQQRAGSAGRRAAAGARSSWVSVAAQSGSAESKDPMNASSASPLVLRGAFWLSATGGRGPHPRAWCVSPPASGRRHIPTRPSRHPSRPLPLRPSRPSVGLELLQHLRRPGGRLPAVAVPQGAVDVVQAPHVLDAQLPAGLLQLATADVGQGETGRRGSVGIWPAWPLLDSTIAAAPSPTDRASLPPGQKVSSSGWAKTTGKRTISASPHR